MSRAPLVYHQPFTMAGRIILAIAALIPLWGAYDLLLSHGMPLLQWGMAPFVAMGLIALVFGLFFLSTAIFSGSRTVTIDRSARLVHVDFAGTFGIHRRFSYAFSALGEARAVELAASDGPPHWAVELPRDRKRIFVESYPDEARARAETAAIAAYMAGR